MEPEVADQFLQMLTSMVEPMQGALESLNAKVEQLQNARGESAGGGRHPRVHFDDRRLRTTAYGNDKGQWRDFAWGLKTFIGRESMALKLAMDQAEKADAEIMGSTCWSLESLQSSIRSYVTCW